MLALLPRLRAAAFATALAVFSAACGSRGSDDVIGDREDSLPPVAVTDLGTTEITTNSITLTWTAPAGDATHNPVDVYDVRYSAAAIDESNWVSATECLDEPGAAPPGWPQTMVVGGLSSATTYHFALKCGDANDRYSPLSNVTSATVMANSEVACADPRLEAALRAALAKPTGPILRSDCQSLRHFDASERGIVQLAGLEECAFLESLDLSGNAISDLSELADLTRLLSLHLSRNQIEELGPLVHLTRLNHLIAASNRVVDLAPLTPLVNLFFLDVQQNRLVEIAGLVANLGLDAGDRVVLYGNPLSTQAMEVDVPALRARGVEVQWAEDEVAPGAISDLRVTAVGSNSVTIAWSAPGDDAMSGTVYAYDVRRAADAATLEGWAGAAPAGTAPTPLPATTPQQMEVGGLTTGTRYYLAIRSRDEAGNWSERSNLVHATPYVDVVVAFADPSLDAAVRDALQKPVGDIYKSELSAISNLQAPDRGIVELSGLEHCENLHTLNLQGNAIRQVAALGGLTYLTDLNLRSNSIADVAPLAALTELFQLDLGANQVAEIAPLAALTRLRALVLGANAIRDASPLAGLAALIHLDLTGNSIQDASALAGLVQLQSLFLGSNQLADLSPLDGLGQLRNLYVDANRVVDVGPLQGLASVEKVYLRFNLITDIHPLAVGTGLGAGDELGLIGNPLSARAIEVDVPALRARGVTVTF